jgi:hypothetical protein
MQHHPWLLFAKTIENTMPVKDVDFIALCTTQAASA